MAYKAYKYRIYPTKEQANKFMQFFGCARFVYNQCLDHYKKQLEEYHKTGKDVEKTPLVTAFKAEYPFLKDCDNAALAYSRTNFLNAISNFYKSKNGKRKGKRVGFPVFKKKGVCKYTYKTCDSHGTIKLHDETYIHLPKIGEVYVKLHRPCVGEIKAVTVSMDKDGKYFVSIMCEIPDVIPNEKGRSMRIVGLDMSYKNFVVDSDNIPDDTKPKYIGQYRKNERKLNRLNRRMHKKLKGSKNRDKSRIKVAKLNRHIANSRMDFCHKLSKYYVDNYDVIVLEDLNLQNMAKNGFRGHSKSLNDLGFGMFREFLEYKALERGVVIHKADKWFASTKTCSKCGYVNKSLKLSDREWICPECGTIHDRDYNAATNLKEYYVKNILNNNTVGTTEINAYGDSTSVIAGDCIDKCCR